LGGEYSHGPYRWWETSYKPCRYFWSTPVMVLPPNWLLPVGLWGRLWHGDRPYKLGIVVWSAVSGRIAGRVFTGLHPTAKPGFDLVAMRKSVIGF
jgi:hypothetical protein